MTEFLLFLIWFEVTVGLVWGGLTLYKIQTDLAVVALHDCAEVDDPNASIDPLAAPRLQIITPSTPPADDETDTVGTFTGRNAWN